MKLLIRLALPTDIAQLPGIERSAAKAFRDTPHAWIEHDGVTEAEDYPELIKDQCVRVAEIDQALAGVMITEIVGRDLHILELSVHQDFQRRGIGRALVESAAIQANEEGCSAVTLTTFVDVPFNAPFYESLGFEILSIPTPRLSAILQAEALHGLSNRCAMRREVSRDLTT
jgi:ribosomal protein S18 acetylase RimI-like enzyme